MKERGSSPNSRHCPILEIGTEYSVGCLGEKCALWIEDLKTNKGACAIWWLGNKAMLVT